MRRHRQLSKADFAVMTGCLILALLTLGAIGESGRRQAKAAVCQANLGQWGAMFEAYTNDHNGHFNPGWDVGETELWMSALRPYYGDRWSLLLCPTATQPASPDVEWGTFTAWSRRVTLSDGGNVVYISSYGINSWTNHMSQDRGARLVECFWGTVRGLQEPDRIPVFADATWHDAWPQPSNAPAPLPLDDKANWAEPVSEMTHFTIDRHSGAVNMLFADWSVRPVGLKELWTLGWHRAFDPEGPWTKAGGVLPSDWPEWMRDYRDY